MDQRRIARAASSERDAAVATIVLAFGSDPAARWLYPDPDRYLASFPSFVRAFAGRAFEHNSVYTVDGCAAAAFWLPPGTHADGESVAALLERSVPPDARAEIFAVFEKMDWFHPAEPHWYLPMIGVDPGHQNRGLGSALLAEVLHECDRDGLPAYLESSNSKNLSFYRRHGFELLATIQVGKSAPIFPMLRKPRRPSFWKSATPPLETAADARGSSR